MSDTTRFEAQMGIPTCLPITSTAEEACQVEIQPEPKVVPESEISSCGLLLTLYEPGQFKAQMSCGKTQSEFVLNVVSPPQIPSELQMQMPPWVEIKPTWGWWSLMVLGGLVVAGVLGGLGWLLLRKLCRSKEQNEGIPKPVWEPATFLQELKRIEDDYRQKRQAEKETAFAITRLLFNVYETAPSSRVKDVFFEGYQRSCLECLDLKFNPFHSGAQPGLQHLIVRYSTELRRAIKENESILS